MRRYGFRCAQASAAAADIFRELLCFLSIASYAAAASAVYDKPLSLPRRQVIADYYAHGFSAVYAGAAVFFRCER